MPTYDYRCDACGHEFELFQQMSAPVKKKCPQCAKLKLKRLIGTGSGVMFKGSGFYETDYRSDSYKQDAKADKESSKPKNKKADSKKNSQTKKKSESKPNDQNSNDKKPNDKNSID
ncbi:zinc ribbon domain-containing protein [PVC group bacterium]|nr:zinc ribbon domain-containing protein [PVC group bacterium]